MNADIHQNQSVIHVGPKLEGAKLAVILLHGRGANAESMLGIVDALGMKTVSFLIPQAALNRWYPKTAFGPLEANEPDLSSALAKVNSLVNIVKENGLSEEQIAFGGFSQGACLAAEYVARNPRKYAGLFVLSGALIGPKGMNRSVKGGFNGMPVFIGGSDVDPWVAPDLLNATASFFKKRGADVVYRIYPGMTHTVNQEEIDMTRKMLTDSISIPIPESI